MAFLKNPSGTLIAACTLVSLSLSGCDRDDTEASQPMSRSQTGKVGVLLASHGDIDELTELEDYVKTAFRRNVGITLPDWIRGPITGPAYLLSVGTVRAQYEIIGPTGYRNNAAKQVMAVNAALSRLGIAAQAYFGANFAQPSINRTLEEMRSDGIETLIVFNKGAQFSYASSGENMDDVLEYLNKHPDWDVKAVGQFQYSEDLRFREVMARALEQDIAREFPNTAPHDLCVMIGSHGLPAWLTDRGDPAIRQMRRTFDWLTQRFEGYRLYHGFLNDDFFPGAKWVSPDAKTLAKTMRAEGCNDVLLDGRLSFTTHDRATLYDMNYVARSILENAEQAASRPGHAHAKPPKVVLAPNFDADPGYAMLIAQLTGEALAGKGDTLLLKDKGKQALPNGSVSKPGSFAKDFAKYKWPLD